MGEVFLSDWEVGICYRVRLRARFVSGTRGTTHVSFRIG